MRRLLIISLALVLAVTGQVLEDDDNEVSEDKDPILNYGVLSQPFRMQKMNLMWEKARKNLQENKLKLLYSELKMQVRPVSQEAKPLKITKKIFIKKIFVLFL